MSGVSGGPPVLEADVPLGPLCTYRVGGRARWLVRLERPDQLEALADLIRRAAPTDADVADEDVADEDVAAEDTDADVADEDADADADADADDHRGGGGSGASARLLVVGQGSNLLVADGGFDGVAVVAGGELAGVSVESTGGGGVRAVVGGAARLPVVARRLAAAGVRGFEWAVGVPGSVGGAVRMNAGGHGADLASCLEAVTVADLRHGRCCTRTAADLELGYRRSSLRRHQLVVAATLRLRRGDPAAARAEIDEIVAWRRANQPGGPNAGSVFTNPAGDSAGRLIEAAGAKGLRLGTAQVSTRHANFIQADAGGRADDVWALMVAVRDLVVRAGGPELRPETVMVGFPPWPTAATADGRS